MGQNVVRDADPVSLYTIWLCWRWKVALLEAVLYDICMEATY